MKNTGIDIMIMKEHGSGTSAGEKAPAVAGEDKISCCRDIWLASEDDKLKEACIIDFHKASGAGGQKVNKTSSAVRLIHKPSGLATVDSTERSQARNVANALKKLRLRIALKIRKEVTSPVPPLSGTPSMNNVRNYSRVLALILDCLEASGWEIPPAASLLGISRTKLLKLVFRDSSLLLEVNTARQELKLPPLQNPQA